MASVTEAQVTKVICSCQGHSMFYFYRHYTDLKSVTIFSVVRSCWGIYFCSVMQFHVKALLFLICVCIHSLHVVTWSPENNWPFFCSFRPQPPQPRQRQFPCVRSATCTWPEEDNHCLLRSLQIRTKRARECPSSWMTKTRKKTRRRQADELWNKLQFIECSRVLYVELPQTLTIYMCAILASVFTEKVPSSCWYLV